MEDLLTIEGGEIIKCNPVGYNISSIHLVGHTVGTCMVFWMVRLEWVLSQCVNQDHFSFFFNLPFSFEVIELHRRVWMSWLEHGCVSESTCLSLQR